MFSLIKLYQAVSILVREGSETKIIYPPVNYILHCTYVCPWFVSSCFQAYDDNMKIRLGMYDQFPFIILFIFLYKQNFFGICVNIDLCLFDFVTQFTHYIHIRLDRYCIIIWKKLLNSFLTFQRSCRFVNAGALGSLRSKPRLIRAVRSSELSRVSHSSCHPLVR